MAEAKLIDFTGAGREDQEWHAAHILTFTKNTRLEMRASGIAEQQELDREVIMKELIAMSQTIPSSWEFVDVTFLLSGVSRATAQQITRTRTASYAMQSQRVVNMSDGDAVNPFDKETQPDLHDDFEAHVTRNLFAYSRMIDNGAAYQDARGILPVNMKCNLVAKYNLRNFVDLVRARQSLRTQGEYADLVEQMIAAVKEVWPWSAVFFQPKHGIAFSILEEVIAELGMTTGEGSAWKIAKAMDLLR